MLVPGSGPVALDEALRSELEALRARSPEPGSAVLEALHRVVRQHGCVPDALIGELAGLLGVRTVDLFELVRCQDAFPQARVARHRVSVCTGLPCALRGGARLLAQLELALGTATGEATRDERLVLANAACLGACDLAPVMGIDGQLYERVDLERAQACLDALESSS